MDLDVVPAPDSTSGYPAAENPGNLLDLTNNKYLNTGGTYTGFIVTPSFGESVVQSFQLTTANDATARDPASFELYGTNDAIVSADNSNGLGGETWSLISSGAIAMPDTRNTLGPVVNIPANATGYTSYKMFFPTLKAASTLMQLAEAQFYDSVDALGSPIFSVGDPILAIDHPNPNPGLTGSSYPGGESPANAIDDNNATKYLNFGEENSGIIIETSPGDEAPTIVRSIQLTTANDSENRDPSSFRLFGTNDDVTSADNSAGGAENWTLIAEGALALPAARLTEGDAVSFANETAYSAYRLVFPTVKDIGSDANSMQIAEIKLLVPEPGSLAAIAALGLLPLRRRRI